MYHDDQTLNKFVCRYQPSICDSRSSDVNKLTLDMAKSLKDLKGWTYILDEERNEASQNNDAVLTPSRRSRRKGNAAHNLRLKREEDDLEIKPGDFILVQEKNNTPEIAIIKEIRFGTHSFLELVITWFIRMRDIDLKDLPNEDEYRDRNKLNENEVFLTAYFDEVHVADIIGKVNVVSEKEFNEDLEIDDSNEGSIFFCRRGCDSAGEVFTTKFDFRELLNLFHKDQASFFSFLKQSTIPVAYSASSKSSPKKKSLREKLLDYESDSVEPQTPIDSRELLPDFRAINNSQKGIAQQESFATEEEDTEDEPSVKQQKNSGSVQKEEFTDNMNFILRKKRKRRTAKSNDNEPRQILASMATINKRIKIKDSSKPTLLSISPKKRTNTTDLNASSLGFDSSSEAFKDLKAKLHTSTKLSSLPCREDEFTSLYLNLETAIQEETGCCVYVSGTPGLGKTATIREVITQLQALTTSGEMKKFDYLEINGLKLISPIVAYEVLWQKISGLKVTASNAALLIESFFSKGTTERPLVVLMDELDQIVTKKQNVMYNFFNWPTYANSKLIVIAVANTMDLPERMLSNKISSRLGLRRIQFVGYTYEQLGAIIRHRLDMMARERKRKVVINPDAIGFASRKVASVSGDARRALAICRRAVEIAEEDYLNERNERLNDKKSIEGCEEETFHVQISHISKAINETVNTPVMQFLSNLPFASKLILAGISLRKKRSGLAENPMGEIVEEMKNSLLLYASAEGDKVLQDIDANMSITDVLYGEVLSVSHEHKRQPHLRIFKFKQALNELVECGILSQQSIIGERQRLVTLNISEDEILTVLKRDPRIRNIL